VASTRERGQSELKIPGIWISKASILERHSAEFLTYETLYPNHKGVGKKGKKYSKNGKITPFSSLVGNYSFHATPRNLSYSKRRDALSIQWPQRKEKLQHNTCRGEATQRVIEDQ
jgi:hypothetical protein